MSTGITYYAAAHPAALATIRVISTFKGLGHHFEIFRIADQTTLNVVGSRTKLRDYLQLHDLVPMLKVKDDLPEKGKVYFVGDKEKIRVTATEDFKVFFLDSKRNEYNLDIVRFWRLLGADKITLSDLVPSNVKVEATPQLMQAYQHLGNFTMISPRSLTSKLDKDIFIREFQEAASYLIQLIESGAANFQFQSDGSCEYLTMEDFFKSYENLTERVKKLEGLCFKEE